MLPLCQDEGVGVIPYSPLARGLLAGSRRHGTKRSEVVRDFTRPEDETVIDRVIDIADERGLKPAQIALAWLLTKPTVTAPIVGATKPHHLPEAVAALDIVLSPEEIARLEEPYRPQAIRINREPVPGTMGAPPLPAQESRKAS